MKILFRMAVLGVIVAVVVFIAKMDPEAMVTNKRDQAAKRWMREHLPNPEAELIGFSEGRNLWDQNYHVAWIRGKNPSGVTVVTHYVFEITPKQEITQGWSSKEFIAVKQLELGAMPHSMQGQRALELQKFCSEMGIPVERGA